MTHSIRQPQNRPWILVAAVGWTLLILALCTVPGKDFPEINIISIDKIGHFGIFAVFGWLWMRVYTLSDLARRSRYVFVGGLAYAVLTEIYQGIMPFGREADLWDAAANAAGLLAGVGVYWGLAASRNSRNRTP
jgi:VanZ family protein